MSLANTEILHLPDHHTLLSDQKKL